MTDAPFFTCPRCGMISHNPNDVREGYCGRCHDWTGDADLQAAEALAWPHDVHVRKEPVKPVNDGNDHRV
jgi:transposase